MSQVIRSLPVINIISSVKAVTIILCTIINFLAACVAKGLLRWNSYMHEVIAGIANLCRPCSYP